MKLGITTSRMNRDFSDEQCLKMIAEAGFTHADFYLGQYHKPLPPYLAEKEACAAHYREMATLLNEIGLEIFQTHAPYPTWQPMRELQAKTDAALRCSLLGSSILGSSYCVIHPQMPRKYRFAPFLPQRTRMNLSFYRKLLPYAEEYQVGIAIENMFSCCAFSDKLRPTACSYAEEMLSYREKLNHPLISFCLDVGHANVIYGDSGKEMFEKLNKGIGCVHLHDNDGVHDLHLAPSRGAMDWNLIKDCMKKIGFDGVINLECHASVMEGGPACVADNLKRIADEAYELFRDLF